MSAESAKFKTNQSITDVDVLYQKLGTQWYAFTVVDGDVYMNKVTEQQVMQARSASHEASNVETDISAEPTVVAFTDRNF